MSDEDVEVRFGASIDGVQAGVTAVKEQLESITGPINELKATFVELGEIMVATFAVEKIADFAKEIAEMGAQVEHATHELGMTSEEISTLNTAFEAMGLGVEGATRSLTRLERNMDSASSGAGPAAYAFRSVGIPLEELRNMKPDEVLNRLADAFSHAPDGPVKTADALAIGGRAFATFIPLLDRGREGLEEFKRITEETGIKLTDEMSGGMEQTSIRMTTLSQAVRGVGVSSFEAFKTEIDHVTIDLTDLVEGFNNATKASGDMATALNGVRVVVDVILAAFIELVAGLKQTWDALDLFADLLAKVLGPVAVAVKDIFTGNWRQMGTDLAQLQATINADMKQRWEDMVAVGRKSAKEVQDIFNHVSVDKPDVKPTGDDLTSAKELEAIDKLIIAITKIRDEALKAEMQMSLMKERVDQTFAQSADKITSSWDKAKSNWDRVQEKIRGDQDKLEKSMEKPWIKFGENIAQVFSTTFDSILTGQQTVTQAMGQMFLKFFEQLIAQVLEAIAVWIILDIVSGGAAAGSGMATDFPIFSQILNSFAVGTDRVPSDMAAFIHKDEMIIPANEANSIRSGANLAAPSFSGSAVTAASLSAAGGGQGAAGDRFEINIQAVDAAGVTRLFQQNGGALVNSIASQRRNLNPDIPAGWA